MSNYTTQTASLKATTIDTRKIDTKQIDTKKLFINGELFDPSQIKESPNEAIFQFGIAPPSNANADGNGFYAFVSAKSNQDGENMVFMEAYLQKGSESEGVLPNGVYARIQIDDNFAKCIGGYSLDTIPEQALYMIPSAEFILQTYENSSKIEQCLLENFLTSIDDSLCWVIKICEEDDNLSELYGGGQGGVFVFVISIPYYIPENDTSTSTYSLRKTNPIDSLREKFEQMKQQMLDNSAE